MGGGGGARERLEPSLRLRMEAGVGVGAVWGEVGCVEGSGKVGVGVCRLINSCIFFFLKTHRSWTAGAQVPLKKEGGKKKPPSSSPSRPTETLTY